MPLSSEQERKIKQELSSYIQFTNCNFCNGNQWTLNNELVGLPVFDTEHKMTVEGSLMPMVVLTCNNCGHAHYFSAMKLGIL